MEVYNVTHSTDMDGMASAALLVRYYRMPLRNITFMGYGERRFGRALEEIRGRKPRNSLIVFSDCATNAVQLRRSSGLVKWLAGRGNTIVWLDHHPWSDAAVRKVGPYASLMVVGENRYMCGAELVYRVLCPKDAFGDRLAGLAHTTDFNLNGGRNEGALRRISYALHYANTMDDMSETDANLRRIVGTLSKGRTDSGRIRSLSGKYLSRSRSGLRKLLKDAAIIEVDGTRIGIGFGDRLDTQEVCMKMLERKRLNVSIYIDGWERRAHMRSDGTFDCSRMAELFNGGGHPKAAAFLLGRPRSRTDTISLIRRGAEKTMGGG